MSAAALWLLILLPAVIGGGLCLAGRRADRVAVALSLGTAALTVVASFTVALTGPAVQVVFLAGAPFGLAVDGLSALIVPAVTVVTLAVLGFAAAEGTRSPARFHGLMLVFTSAVSITATATTVPTLLFAWEIMGAMSYALIGFHWRDDTLVSAGLVAFLTTRAGDLGLYLAAGAALAGGGGLGLAQLPDAPAPWRDLVAAGILLAAFGKAAQLPFSFWLSRAMAGPSPVSALLHSAAMVAMGGYLLLRVAPLLQTTGWAAIVAAWVGALTALLLGAVAVAQRDLKQLLAASTAAQLGFVVLAAGVGSVAGGTAQLIAHAATKALLFLVAGAWLTALDTRRLSALRGAARRWPLVGVSFTIGALSLAGFAPFSLWATKDEVLAGALQTDPMLYVVGLAASALSAAYAGKALVMVWRWPLPGTEDGYDTEQLGTRRIGLWERIPLVVLAAGAALLGLLALPPVGDGVRVALGAGPAPQAGLLELAGSALLALAVLALAAWGRLPQPSWAANWLGLETMTRVLVVDPVLRLSGRLARFDLLLDRSLYVAARTAARSARRLNRFDAQGMDAAVEATAALFRRLGDLARRPQTGRLHQYYAGITVTLAIALILLLVVR